MLPSEVYSAHGTHMMIFPYVTIACFFLCAIAAGWIVFTLVAGYVVYSSCFTINHANLEPKPLRDAEKKSVIYAHTKDPRIMDPINAAKERWFKNLDAGVFEPLSVVSREGFNLAGYYWPAEGRAETEPRWVILVHGMMDSAAGMGYLAEEYHAAGWNVLSVDQRAHGESEGKRRTMGVRESEDLSLWVSALINRYGADCVYIHGISMGGAAVLLYAAHSDISSAVKGCISDSGYARHGAVFMRLLKLATGSGFVAWSISLGSSVVSFCLTGIGFWRMAPEKFLPSATRPVLLFHGQDDALVPIGMVRKMHGMPLKPGSESVVIPDAAHIGPYFCAKALYLQKIEDFYRRSR